MNVSISIPRDDALRIDEILNDLIPALTRDVDQGVPNEHYLATAKVLRAAIRAAIK